MSTTGSIALSPSIVVLICIIGAAALVCVAAAVHKLFARNAADENIKFNERSNEQDEYMREGRLRNLEIMRRELGCYGRREQDPVFIA